MEHVVRRLIAQHDLDGVARFAIDEQLQLKPFGADAMSELLWVTDRSPADNMDDRDLRVTLAELVSEGGAAVRILNVAPGAETPMHRTISLDFLVITKGEIDLELEGGETRTLKAGDFAVQRGTNHRWINRSGDWMQMIAFLLAAEPVTINGKMLPEIHI